MRVKSGSANCSRPLPNRRDSFGLSRRSAEVAIFTLLRKKESDQPPVCQTDTQRLQKSRLQESRVQERKQSSPAAKANSGAHHQTGLIGPSIACEPGPC